MLNVRKLKQDISPSVLKEGKELFDSNKVLSAKIISLDTDSLRINAKVVGQFNNTYESEIEIDRIENETIDSDCDCPYNYDCQHIAAVLFHLEAHLDDILVAYSKENDLEEMSGLDSDEKEELLDAVKEAVSKQEIRQGEQYQKELMQEYLNSSTILSDSPFFLPIESHQIDQAELAIMYTLPAPTNSAPRPIVELQMALRLPCRSKPLHIPNAKDFLDGIRYEEQIGIGGRKYFFTFDSFREDQREIARMLVDYARVHDKATTEKGQKSAFIELKAFGMILSTAFEVASKRLEAKGYAYQEGEHPQLPCIYEASLEQPLKFSLQPAIYQMNLEYIEPPTSKLLINPVINIESQTLMLEDMRFFESTIPGMIHEHVYYRFQRNISRQHLIHLFQIRDMTIPEPLFGAFVEYSLPELTKFADVVGGEVVSQIVTLPNDSDLSASCDLSYLNGELEAEVFFDYSDKKIPAANESLSHDQLISFVNPEGVLARDLIGEKKLLCELFDGFVYSPETGVYQAKSDKKIIEFMTEIIPSHQGHVTFNCPQNLLDQFIYDSSKFSLSLSHTDRMDIYEIDIQVDGHLNNIHLDQLWECLLSRRSYLELDGPKKARKADASRIPKILVLDLSIMGRLVQLFDELGIEKLSNHKLKCPLWSLANIDETNFKGLPVKFTMTKPLKEIRAQMLGEKSLEFSPIPKSVKADLRSYQTEGVNWLERLRLMFLNGILADDMGLGKTLQAICALSQMQKTPGRTTVVICPTSLLYNWKEELNKFAPKMSTLVVDGVPSQRKKLIEKCTDYDVVITSYSLLQKDISDYEKVQFAYTILDEAQHIKNRGTRNAKSVKMLKSDHRLILSGTPIENSLDELWSLFDFLMPGFLGSYERFVEKYMRVGGEEQSRNLQYLRAKVSPFILRRMKADVLDDLPPVSEITYHCQLSKVQMDLYKSYATSAKEELVKLVEKEGFQKVQIHVLATLTRLKQICCHPAIFAKQNPEEGDSSKYDMLTELLNTLIEGNHKIVLFSQYTKMLQIMRQDFEQRGIRFVYLDGSSKNRLEIVNQFNNDEKISVFLVSLKAGGTGLNLTSADTVIHYDMWWNPAVESQATDRVHRLGQKQNVSVYKLVTKNSIEEKIVEMQNRKKGIVKKVVSCDEEAMSKLTWEDVLELLKT
ncbi:MAG: RNA polymerase-associated protein RapA [Chlamydiia bacterium]|nr:RNA polymerase-associated protein RapA [Chlamydiia bacterium]